MATASTSTTSKISRVVNQHRRWGFSSIWAIVADGAAQEKTPSRDDRPGVNGMLASQTKPTVTMALAALVVTWFVEWVLWTA
jgi:hypothetical protein